jgi:D-glycero-D-manno-heptose 1,7-bisphosphate phosphatase
MITQLARELDLDLGDSWVVGDSESDVLAGKAAGYRAAPVGRRNTKTAADVVAGSLAMAGELIAAQSESVLV